MDVLKSDPTSLLFIQPSAIVVGIFRGGLYYNGGSSIWSPEGRKLAQAPVVPPEVLPPGLHGFISATIVPARADAVRDQRLAARRPSLYNPLLALRRAPVDSTATTTRRPVDLAAAQWPSQLESSAPRSQELLVLPELSGLPAGLSAEQIRARAERRGGAFESRLAARAKGGGGYLVGSYPEREGERVFHTVVLAGPGGQVLGRYRATHLSAAERVWAQGSLEVKQNSVPEMVLASPAVPEAP